jgi:DNA-binding Lrp family transcriptional regulator
LLNKNASFKLRQEVILTLDNEWDDPSEFCFSERDNDVLALLSEEDLTTFSFDGLKRRLGLHPETLSRVLNRLEQEGIVKKGSTGYDVTPKINGFARLHPTSITASRVPLLQTYLPSDLPVPQLVSNLKGKWFGLLRWLGLSACDGSVTLKWITEDGGVQVDANISESVLNIEAKFFQDKNLNIALKASYQLLTHVSKLCSPSRLARHVSYFGDSDLNMTSA